MEYGYVYILTNKEVPSLVKIGYTNRTPFERANELSRFTGVPGDWEVYKYWKLPEARTWESRIFDELKGYRQTGEFFRLKPTKAKDIILIFLKESGGLDSEGFSAADRAEFAKAASRNREYETNLRKKRIDKEWEESRAKREAQALDRAERAFGQKTSVIIRSIEDARNKPLEFLSTLVAIPLFMTWWLFILVPGFFLMVLGDPFKIASTLLELGDRFPNLEPKETEEVKKWRRELEKIYKLSDQFHQKDKEAFYDRASNNQRTLNTKSINSNTNSNSNSLDVTKKNADLSNSHNGANSDPFLKSYQANEKARLKRLAKIKAHDSSLIISRTDTISGKSNEFRPVGKVTPIMYEFKPVGQSAPLKRETPSIKHFLPVFREYKSEKRQANQRLAKHEQRPVSEKEANNEKSVSDTFLENYQKQEKIRLEKLAKAKADGKYIEKINISPDSLIDSKQNAKKSNWKTFEVQIKSIKETKDKDGRTALHRAAINGDAIAILKLIDAGAHKTPKDRHGKAPWDYAKTNKKLLGSTAYYVLKSRDP